jgi:hypothetical protein
MMLAATMSAQQPPPIGIAPVAVGPGPYTFDTAEQPVEQYQNQILNFEMHRSCWEYR